MKTLSGQQPFWWAILHAGKRIENRKRNMHYRGPILLHASLTEYRGGADLIRKAIGIDVPPFESLPRGGIVGRARIVDVVSPQDDIPPSFRGYPAGVDGRWHMPEQYGFVLEDVEPLPFVACKGALGLWECDYEALIRGAA